MVDFIIVMVEIFLFDLVILFITFQPHFDRIEIKPYCFNESY